MLVDSRGVVEQVWRRWAAARGRDPEPFIAICHGRRTSETLALVAPDLDAAAEARALDAMEETETEGLEAIPGARELVLALPASRWGIVTSGHAAVARLRLGAALIPEPAVLVTGETVTRGKPAPEGYLAAARRLGFPPAQCVVIEDAPPGIEAARSAGMRVIAVATTLPASALARADYRIDGLDRLRVAAGATRDAPLSISW